MIRLFLCYIRPANQTDKKMKTLQQTEKAEMMMMILEHISADRHRIIKELWENRWSIASRGRISGSIAATRDGLYETLTGSAFIRYMPVAERIASLDQSKFNKSMMILFVLGLEDEMIADILCVNKTFIAVSRQRLMKEYPEFLK